MAWSDRVSPHSVDRLSPKPAKGKHRCEESAVRGRSCDDRRFSWWFQHHSGIPCLPLTAASLPLLQHLSSALFTFNTCQAPERDRSPGLGLGGPAQAPGLSQHASQKCCFLEPSRLPVQVLPITCSHAHALRATQTHSWLSGAAASWGLGAGSASTPTATRQLPQLPVAPLQEPALTSL